MKGAIFLLVATTAAALTPLPARAQEEAREPRSVQVDLEEPGTALRGVVDYHTGHAWWYGARTLCAAPCTIDVPAEATYQVVGRDMPESALFSLPNRHDVLLDVHRGNKATHDAATFFAIAGGVALGVGAVFLIGELGSGTAKLSDTDMTTGLVLTGVGAGGLAVSIPLLIASATTIHFQ